MIYFISDNHFGHANIIKLCNRPFATVEEMDAVMIQRWNAKVHKNDTVYILGDMFFRSSNVEEVLSLLKGRKHLITGNHDKTWQHKVDIDRYFESVQPYMEIVANNRHLTLCHYPMLSWNNQRRGYMIHGHIHNDTKMDYWPMIASRDRVLNAGVEINGFEPVPFEDLLANNVSFKQAHSGGSDGELR